MPDSSAPDKSVPPPPEVITVGARRVACDGGGGALGHPRVWMTIPFETGFVDCGYCDRRFVFEGGPGGGSGADH